jgi:hypothetical protein
MKNLVFESKTRFSLKKLEFLNTIIQKLVFHKKTWFSSKNLGFDIKNLVLICETKFFNINIQKNGLFF